MSQELADRAAWERARFESAADLAEAAQRIEAALERARETARGGTARCFTAAFDTMAGVVTTTAPKLPAPIGEPLEREVREAVERADMSSRPSAMAAFDAAASALRVALGRARRELLLMGYGDG